MSARALPARPSLEQYRKQAKDLVKRWKARDPETLRHVREHHPRLKFSDSEQATFGLADAQLVIAREHGFASWPMFTTRIDTLIAAASQTTAWHAAERAIVNGDAPALERLLRDHDRMFRDEQPPAYVPRGPRPDYSGLDARTIIAREHQFESWDLLERHIAAVRDERSPAARFEAATEAVITGDAARLEGLLRTTPDLVHARSPRSHHSTLLHYIGANGVEGFRQRTPANAVAITEALLDAGADVDAVADMYGGNARTLELVATSIHPRLAGVQDDLMELLIVRGASFEANEAIVIGCLANGRGQAAEFLAKRGAPLGLEGAAGLGRLEIVRNFFNPDGTLTPAATVRQMRDGFTWACEYGRAEVVDFLLQHGVDVNARLRAHQQSALHLAAFGGHVGIAEQLLERGARVDSTDGTFGTTPLMWALYAWSQEPQAAPERYYEVVAALVGAGSVVQPEWLDDEKVRADIRMVAALSVGRRTGGAPAHRPAR